MYEATRLYSVCKSKVRQVNLLTRENEDLKGKVRRAFCLESYKENTLRIRISGADEELQAA